MRIGSLFAGYDGIGLAVEALWPDAERAWFVEFDQAPSKILAHHWPDVPNHGDITAVDWDAVKPVDILTGGFPCQDLSHAGKRLGLRPGTRSGLWEHMAYAIDRLRPRLVVIENVRGLLSAEAHSDMERDCWCVGDEREPAPLRALGAVLGDLAELGYDARWGGVRAADAGAPHGRFRVFVVAQPADTDLTGLEGRPAERERAGERPAGPGGVGAVALLPTATASMATGAGTSGRDGGPNLQTAVDALLPTPKASDGPNGGPGMRNGRGEADALPGVVSLLPTPTSQAAKHGGTPDVNANGYGSNLWDLPHLLNGDTDALPAEARPDQALSDVRGADDPQAVRAEADPRGHGPVHVAEDLRPGLWQHADGGDAGGPPLEGGTASGRPVPGVRDDGGPARPSHRPGPDAQRPGQPDDAVRELPHSAALAGGPPAADGGGQEGAADFGPYTAAIRRWERILGRPSPSPTQPGRDGRPRLAPDFVEFLMGLPLGHVTDPAIGLTRAQQLKALGNGVVPQQAALALRLLLSSPAGGVTRPDPARSAGVGASPLLPTPEAHESGSTPESHLARKPGRTKVTALNIVVEHLLPTPNPFHAGNEEDPDEWRARRADVFKRTGTQARPRARRGRQEPAPRPDPAHPRHLHARGRLMTDLTYLGTCCCCGNEDAYYPVCVDCVPQADCTHGDESAPDD